MRLITIFVALMLAGCADRGDCLESRMQVSLIPLMVGKTMIMQPRMTNVCDLWQYPDGRPS